MLEVLIRIPFFFQRKGNKEQIEQQKQERIFAWNCRHSPASLQPVILGYIYYLFTCATKSSSSLEENNCERSRNSLLILRT